MRLSGSWFAAVAAVACMAAVGCGEDGGEAPATAAALPAITTPPEAVAKRLMKVLGEARRRRDCKPVDAINERSSYQFACPQLDDVRASFAKFEVVDAATYGTAAVIDYRTGGLKDGATMIMHVTPDREWAFTHFGLLYQAVGTSDGEDVAGYERTVERYLRAIRERDCALFYQHALTSSDDEKATCRREFPHTKELGRAMRQSPNAEPEYLGGNERFGFYALELTRPRPAYRTLTVFKTDPGTLQPYLVLSGIPGPVPSDRDGRRRAR